jgi:sugar/nucleoside kinase (ribokinase family)
MASVSGRSGVVCAGALTVDIIKRIDHWPEPESLAEILGEEREGGASTFNMAVDLRKLGATFPVSVMGLAGQDPGCDFLLDACRSYSIDTSRVVRTAAAPTSYTEVMSDAATGRRTFFYCPGANALLAPEHFDFAACNARIAHVGMPGIHASMDGPHGGDANGWVTVLKRARAAGLMTNVELVSIAPDRIAAVSRPFLPYLDFLIVNDAEIGALAGVETVREGRTDVAAVRRSAQSVMDAGSLSLVVAHFPLGCVAVTRDGQVVAKPSVNAPPSEVRGTNGAGDAFAAGILYGLMEGWGLQDMLTLAHASAAASLRALSTVGSVDHWKDVLALAERWGWRDSPSHS